MLHVIMVATQPLSPTCVAATADAVGATLLVAEDGTYHLDMHANDVRMRIEDMGNGLMDWMDEPDRLARLQQLGDSLRIYVVHYKDVIRLRDVLIGLAQCSDFILDDDYDLFVDGKEFVALCNANPDHNRWWLGGRRS